MDTCCTLRKRANTKPKNLFHWIRKIDTYVQNKRKNKTSKNHKQNKKQRQKQMGMFFRHIYKPKICGFSVILATMGDFSDNIFLRASLEELLKHQWLLAPPALVRVPERVPLELWHSQMHHKVIHARAKLERSSSQEDAMQHTTSIQNWRTTWN